MSSIDDAGLIHDQEDIAGGNSLSTDKQTSTGDATLRNLIHIKESEIAALKEVITKWRTRALNAHIMHTEAKAYYDEQLVKLQMQHEDEINAIKNTRSKNAFEKDDDSTMKTRTAKYDLKINQSKSRTTILYQDESSQELEIYTTETPYRQAKVLGRLVKSFPKFIRKTAKKPKYLAISPAAIDLNFRTLDHKHKCYNISKNDLKLPYKSDGSISKSSSSDTIAVEENTFILKKHRL